jgi:hypothetical protein
MDHVTHSLLLWVVVGSAVLAVFLWLAMLSASEGRERDADLDQILAHSSPAASIVDGANSRARSAETVTANADRFRALGDPEYGLFLEDSQRPGSAISAA